MAEKMIYVPYEDFVEGVKALAALESVRTMITGGDVYCSSSVLSVLGLAGQDVSPAEVKKTDGISGTTGGSSHVRI